MLVTADAARLPLVDGCVQTVVTSPPYWGLRDYGLAPRVWGPLDCTHVWDDKGVFCGLCEAWRGNLGLEPTPDTYIEHVVTVFREVWRVLRSDGTLWLNLGDCYYSGDKGGGHRSGSVSSGTIQATHMASDLVGAPNRQPQAGLKPKDLVGIPWRIALALQADGWYLRSDIIWSKPNPMPESVTDRPTCAHEYLFLLSKSERYYYDADAIKEPCSLRTHPRGNGLNPKATGKNETSEHRRYDGFNARWNVKQNASFSAAINGPVNERNKRSVWEIAAQPYSGDHFATFPEALVEPCILAGCPMGGLVFDPFIGSGTVGAVAERLSRKWVGTDLSYQPLARARTAQGGLRFEMEARERGPC